MVAATIRTVFVQPDTASAREQWRRVANRLRLWGGKTSVGLGGPFVHVV